ncbi:MAG: type I polyketide synthase, partial [Pseudomonadota bacterium]
MSEPLDIAIIGMEGLFAKAPDIDTFWSNILNKVDAVTEASDEWLGEPRLLDPDAPPEKLRLYTNRGGFLGDLSRFDPRPHGTMPISVLGGEADQFLALDCSAKVLENAGYGAERDYDRSRVGCILGHAIHANRGNVNGFGHALVIDQVLNGLGAVLPGMTEEQREAAEAILRSQLPKFSVDTLPALVPNMMTGRICNRLDLMGPNYILDGACASTSIALLAAADELRTGRADMMLAGGVNTTSSTLVYGVFCQLGALSRSAKVKPFSSDADGTLLGEGQGIFLLKRLDDALRDDDRIISVLRGIGISSDGRSSGLMAPWQKGEALAIKRAYEQSGTDPNTIDLLEAHGTGIPLGDRTEIDALREVFGERTKPAPHIALGSVKSMIGHCIPAAGAASLAKVCKAIGEGILPPTLVDEQNPDLGLETTSFYLSREARPWLRRKDQPRRAGIDSFGFGGINSHILVEESPQALQTDVPTFGVRRREQPELIVLTAATRDGMIDAAGQLGQRINDDVDLATLADECALADTDGPCRLGVLATSLSDLAKKLTTASERLAALQGDGFALSKPGVFYSEKPLNGKTVFMFPGEMSQYPNMLSDLAMASPSTTAWLSRLEGLYGDDRERPHRHLLFGPRDAVSPEEAEATDRTLERVEEGSEAVFFADMAYHRLLDQLGVEADMMIGHSTGENAALIASQTIGFDKDGVSNFIRQMNKIFVDIDQSGAVPEGALLNIGAAPDGTVEAALERHSDLRLTMDNCPNQAILFGPEPVIEEAAKELTASGAVCQPLPIAWAYHTEHIAPLADQFHELFAAAPLGQPRAVLYSCSTAAPYPPSKDEAIAIAAQQYKTRVRFTDAVRRLYDDGARLFVEVGASSSLSGFVRDTLTGKDVHVVSCDNRRRPSLESLLKALGHMFALGVFTKTERLAR